KSALLSKLGEMLKTYNQEILAEPFIAGREFSIGVIARTNDIEVLSILEVDFSKMPASVGNVFGLIAKSDYDDLENYLCPAPINKDLELALRSETINACKALNIRDFARLDFRVDDSNKPWFLEINPLPGMDYDETTKDFSFYPLIAMKSGYDYNSLINELIKSCIAHHALKNR
ncbi:MAG: D-alanine-D-alanine ligase, partial [Rickettsiales bacterium]